MSIESSLAAIRERAEKASPAPWKVLDDAHQDIIVRADNETPLASAFDNDDSGLDPIDNEQSDRNLAFIAAARTDVPTLLAALEHEMETSERMADFDQILQSRRAELLAILKP